MAINKKTYSQKPSEVNREWFLVDASTAPLGKLAVVIANRLTGKSKPTFTPHVDNGDYVVVINAKKVVVTGNKMLDKKYYRHSGYPGSMKELSLEEVLEKDFKRVIEDAVKGMIPKNKLAADRLARLRVFADENHTHTAQQPKKVEVK